MKTGLDSLWICNISVMMLRVYYSEAAKMRAFDKFAVFINAAFFFTGFDACAQLLILC